MIEQFELKNLSDAEQIERALEWGEQHPSSYEQTITESSIEMLERAGKPVPDWLAEKYRQLCERDRRDWQKWLESQGAEVSEISDKSAEIPVRDATGSSTWKAIQANFDDIELMLNQLLEAGEQYSPDDLLWLRNELDHFAELVDKLTKKGKVIMSDKNLLGWQRGLKDDFDRLEHRIEEMTAQGVPDDDPQMEWLKVELDHFFEMAERMAADDEAMKPYWLGSGG
jgi:hypothetical protein